jgi:chromosome segregation ATPase
MTAETIDDMLLTWRTAIADEIEASVTELRAAGETIAAAEAEASRAADRRRELRERVGQALVSGESIAGALASRLDAEEPATRTAAAEAERARRNAGNLEYRLRDLREGLSQIDRILAPVAATAAEPPEPSRHRREPQSVDADVIVFPHRGAAA